MAPLHPHQWVIDEIFIRTAKGSKTQESPEGVVRLLREAGIDPAELGLNPDGDHRKLGRDIANLRWDAQERKRLKTGFGAASEELKVCQKVLRRAKNRVKTAKDNLESAEREFAIAKEQHDAAVLRLEEEMKNLRLGG